VVSQLEVSEQRVSELENASRPAVGSGTVAATPVVAVEDHAKLSRERSLQWQEVNSLLEDEIGRMRWAYALHLSRCDAMQCNV